MKALKSLITKNSTRRTASAFWMSLMDDNEILSWCEKISQTIDGVPFCASEREIGDDSEALLRSADRDSLINFIADTQWIWQIVPPPGMASFPTTESA